MRQWRLLLGVLAGLTAVLLLLAISGRQVIHAEDEPNKPLDESRLVGYPMTVTLVGGTTIQGVTFCSLVNHRGVCLFLLYVRVEDKMQQIYLNPAHVVMIKGTPRDGVR